MRWNVDIEEEAAQASKQRLEAEAAKARFLEKRELKYTEYISTNLGSELQLDPETERSAPR